MRLTIPVRAVLVAALVVASPSLAHAQFGKLLKKVAGDAAGETSGGTAAGQRGAVIPITAEVVDRFLAAYSAEKAQETRRTDILRYQDCLSSEEFDQEKLDALQQQRYDAVSEGDSAAVRRVDAQMARARAGKCGAAPADWDEDNPYSVFEVAGAAAGRFAHRDYLVLRERMEAYYYIRKGRDSYRQYRFTDAERQAIAARESALLAMIGKAVEGER